jgi:hypothetical protein
VAAFFILKLPAMISIRSEESIGWGNATGIF